MSATNELLTRIARSKAVLQGVMAVASFTAGTAIACINLFAIEPLGEISDSSTRIVTEFLLLCAACLGVTAYISEFKSEVKRESAELKSRLSQLEHER